MKKECQVAAIIVTYQPNLIELEILISNISKQVTFCLIVDNTPEEITAEKIKCFQNKRNIKYCWMKDNIGVAAAHNYGINWAERLNNNYVLLLDQDSLPSSTMVVNLVQVLLSLEKDNIKVCSVGPMIINRDHQKSLPLIKIGRFSVKRKYYENRLNKDKLYEQVTFLPSSGSLIPISIIKKIGWMDEQLFIDYIDIEWQLRARKNTEYHCYVSYNAVMQHSIGEKTYRIWLGKWRHLNIHKPFRYYYIYRNAFNVYKQNWRFLRWVIFDIRRLIQTFIICIISGSRSDNLRMIFWGLLDGISQKKGKSIRF